MLTHFLLQVSHTLLQLVDKKTGQPFERPQMRLAVFVTKLRSALPQVFGWLPSTSLQGATRALLEKSEESKKSYDVHKNFGFDTSFVERVEIVC